MGEGHAVHDIDVSVEEALELVLASLEGKPVTNTTGCTLQEIARRALVAHELERDMEQEERMMSEYDKVSVALHTKPREWFAEDAENISAILSGEEEAHALIWAFCWRDTYHADEGELSDYWRKVYTSGQLDAVARARLSKIRDEYVRIASGGGEGAGEPEATVSYDIEAMSFPMGGPHVTLRKLEEALRADSEEEAARWIFDAFVFEDAPQGHEWWYDRVSTGEGFSSDEGFFRQELGDDVKAAVIEVVKATREYLGQPVGEPKWQIGAVRGLDLGAVRDDLGALAGGIRLLATDLSNLLSAFEAQVTASGHMMVLARMEYVVAHTLEVLLRHGIQLSEEAEGVTEEGVQKAKEQAKALAEEARVSRFLEQALTAPAADGEQIH